MTGEIGQLALCLALALALVHGGRRSCRRARRRRAGAQPSRRARRAGLLVFVGLAFGALTYASIVSDFSILNVAQNSHTLKPLIYKISGVWGNHEGSMLLWVLVLAIYSGGDRVLAARQRAADQRGARRAGSSRRRVPSLYSLHLQSVPAPRSGAVRGRRAQSAAAGFRPRRASADALCRLCRSLGIVRLCRGRADHRASATGRAPRGRSCSSAWIALTIGIALGSWWAYYELGWGGFWFWDPVENASLMPWLVATALLHSALATERTGAFRSWTLAARHRGLLAQPDRHVPGALRRAVVGAFLRQRSGARRLYIWS